MKSLVCLTFVCAAMSLPTFAFAKRTRTVDEALKREYPDAKTEIVSTRTLNGVKLNEVKVMTKDGEARAEVTEFGDFVVVGEPRGTRNLSKPAQDTLDGLFHTQQQDVGVYRVTSYYVDVTAGHRTFRLIIDPVGKIHDIQNESEIKRDDIRNLEKVDSKEHAMKADDYAKKYMEGDKVEGVYRLPDSEDFYVVDLRQKDGKDARITLSNVGRIFSQREEIAIDELPKPVLDTINQTFDATKGKHAYRYEYEYYQIDKVSSGGEHVEIQIRPNGDVLKVRTSQEEGTVAGHKEQPK
jgi:hypothetical protein